MNRQLLQCYGALLTALSWQAVNAAPPLPSPLYQAFFYQGLPLEAIPDYGKLAPAVGSKVNNLTLNLVAGQLQGPANNPQNELFTFATYLYNGGARGQEQSVGMFGPTIRVPADTNISLRLTNDLIGNDKIEGQWENSFHQPTHTNIHMHGIWQFPGVLAQPASGLVQYTTGDTVFVDVIPRATASSDSNFIEYTYYVHENHMPGTYWYHPHHHGSTALQAMTSAGVIIIDGDAKYLNTAACSNMARAVAAAPEQILFLQTMFFNSTSLFDASQFTPGFGASFDSSLPIISNVSNPMNPLCCNPAENGLPFNAAAQNDTAFVSGAYQPIVNLQAGLFTRWRIINASWKRYMELFIINADGSLAQQCEMQLIAKDGLYMLRIPRRVQHVVLPASGRADVLVRCNGTGEYLLSSGVGPNLYGPGVNLNFEVAGQPNRFIQKELATVRVTAAARAPDPSFNDQECRPLRSDYSADLSDANLERFNVPKPSWDNKKLKNVSWSQPPNIGRQLNPGCFINPKNLTDLNQYQFPDPYPITFQVGSVYQIDFFDQAFHPGHLHENPMQIYYINRALLGENTTLTNYWQEGDFHDTLYIPVVPGAGAMEASIRVQPGPFTGYSVFHCHFLHHEDQGCMSVVKWECPGYPGNQQVFPCPNFQEHGFSVRGDFHTDVWPGWATVPFIWTAPLIIFQLGAVTIVGWTIGAIVTASVLGGALLAAALGAAVMSCRHRRRAPSTWNTQ